MKVLNHLVCTGCARTEPNSYDIGDECCSCGEFVLPVPDDYYQKYDRLGKVANQISAVLFGNAGAYGAEIVAGVQTASSTIWTMKSALEAIAERGCGCYGLRDQGSICQACIASEALDRIRAEQRNLMLSVEANIKSRRNGYFTENQE